MSSGPMRGVIVISATSLNRPQTLFTATDRDGLLLILASSRLILGTSDSRGGEGTFTNFTKMSGESNFPYGVVEAETTDSDVMRLKHKVERKHGLCNLPWDSKLP